jgi:hypothetical protein
MVELQDALVVIICVVIVCTGFVKIRVKVVSLLWVSTLAKCQTKYEANVAYCGTFIIASIKVQKSYPGVKLDLSYSLSSIFGLQCI